MSALAKPSAPAPLDPAEPVIFVSRTFDAPRDLVFQMFTDPRHLPHFWGGRGVTTEVLDMDVRPGGLWRYTMRMGDGAYTSSNLYLEVTAPERIVYRDLPDGWMPGKPLPPVQIHTTIHFVERDGKTKVSGVIRADTIQLRDQMARSGFSRTVEESYDRMADYLGDLAGTVTVLSRFYAAPRDLVFGAWVEPRHLLRWFHASEGWTTPFVETDPRLGGSFRIGFGSPDGSEDFVLEGTYTAFDRPARLAFVMSDGRPVSVSLLEENGGTRLLLELALEKQHSEAEQRDGWGAQLDNLTAVLANPA